MATRNTSNFSRSSRIANRGIKRLRVYASKAAFTTLACVVTTWSSFGCSDNDPSPSVESTLSPTEGETDGQNPFEAEMQAFADELMRSCALAETNDQESRDACARDVGDSKSLRDAMTDLVLWGGHNPEKHTGFDPSTHNLTRFSAFIFRRIYLSTFMFNGSIRMERDGDLGVLHMPTLFRNKLDPGAYPYPFWHSEEKWNAYQFSTELIFVFKAGKVIAVYRSGTDQELESHDPGTFDGDWRWVDEQGDEQPKVSLYSYILSKDNPHTEQLDVAYRAFEEAAREKSCLSCHAPDNAVKMKQLVLFTYPAQALGGRHELISVFEKNSMPPEMPLDPDTLQNLTVLAKEFASIGDQALEYENQR